jgi:hypothetical protein
MPTVIRRRLLHPPQQLNCPLQVPRMPFNLHPLLLQPQPLNLCASLPTQPAGAALGAHAL